MTISPVVLFSLSPLTIVLIIVAVITIGLIIFLAIWGKKTAEKDGRNRRTDCCRSTNSNDACH